MGNQEAKANKIIECDEKDVNIFFYLARWFEKTPKNEKRRQWWLANSEFTEYDLDLIADTADLFDPEVSRVLRYREHAHCYRSNCHDQIVGADSPITYSGLRDLVKKIRDFVALRESSGDGSMSNQLANRILKSDEKEPNILFYLARKVFQKTPENEKQRLWWLANSDFTEEDLDLISDMANLFRPVDAIKTNDDEYDKHIKLFVSNSLDQIVGADSPVTYFELRDLVNRIRRSAAFPESLGISY